MTTFDENWAKWRDEFLRVLAEDLDRSILTGGVHVRALSSDVAEDDGLVVVDGVTLKAVRTYRRADLEAIGMTPEELGERVSEDLARAIEAKVLEWHAEDVRRLVDGDATVTKGMHPRGIFGGFNPEPYRHLGDV